MVLANPDTYGNEQAPPERDDLPEISVTVGGEDATPSPELTELPGGGAIIHLFGSGAARKRGKGAQEHDANLAEFIDDYELGRISSDLLDGISADLQSRDSWIRSRADGLKHLATRLENPRTPSPDTDTAVEGQSTVRSPIMLDAVMRFQANARGELLPAGGPVKITNWTTQKTNQEQKNEEQLLAQAQPPPQPGQPPSPQPASPPDDTDLLAEALERDFNHYLTVIDRAYYPDTNRMFFTLGYAGSGFKKVYRCPILRRPVSRTVDFNDVIVSDSEVSLQDCGRVTHRIQMRQSVFKRMELSGAYITHEDALSPAAPDPDPVDLAKDEIGGLATPYAQRPSDYKHTIYECYCELDIKGFEHKDGGARTGLPLPYRVTIDKDSQNILEVRRNWKEDDDRYLARMPIVKYPFVEGLTFYGLGLLDIMGNTTAAISAAWRLALDSAGFSSWPGFLYSDTVGRQDTMTFRVGLGAGVKINTNGQDIRGAIMPLPYKDVTAGLVQVTTHLEEEARRVGGTPELMTGEGRQDTPVGTTLAMLDQAVKVIDSVHKGMHIAQAEELSLLRDLFIDDPASLLCNNAQPARQWELPELTKALSNCNLTPQSDPNTPSHTIRVMKAVALVQLVQMAPDKWKIQDVIKRVAAMVGLGSVAELLAPPPPPGAPPPDPKMAAAAVKLQTHMQEMQQRSKDAQQTAQLEEANSQLKLLIEQMHVADNQAERASRERIEYEKNATERLQLAEAAMVHPAAVPYAQQMVQNWPGGLPPPGRTI